jgi:hypothetical protein
LPKTRFFKFDVANPLLQAFFSNTVMEKNSCGFLIFTMALRGCERVKVDPLVQWNNKSKRAATVVFTRR